MRINEILFVMVLSALSFTSSGYAQKGIQDGSKFGHGEDSILCMQNLSLFTSYIKQGDYTNALEFWNKIYDECPASHISIYTYGPNLITKQLEEEKFLVRKDKLFNRLMSIYDNRIKYFSDNARYGKAYILGRKAIDYIRYANPSRDPLRKNAYKWLSEAIDIDGATNEAAVFQQYFILSDKIYKSRPDAFRETYINDYLKIIPMLNERADSGDPKDTVYVVMKTMVEAMFAQSGVTDCKILDEVYGKRLDAKQKDKDFLDVILTLYPKVDCEESPVCFKAANYRYKLEPTAASACGLAIQAYQNKDYDKAISYFEEAVSLESEAVEKSKIQMKVAATYNDLGKYIQARAASMTALNYNPSNSTAYILIAHLYTQYCTLISTDPVIQKTAYWAAVDKLKKAKTIDPSCAEEANKLIDSYEMNFPSKSELSQHHITGNTYTVPGWIQEKTTIR